VLLSVLSVGLLAQVFEYRILGWSWSLRGFQRGGQHRDLALQRWLDP